MARPGLAFSSTPRMPRSPPPWPPRGWTRCSSTPHPRAWRKISARFGLPLWRAIGVGGRADLPAQAHPVQALLIEPRPPAGASRPGGNGLAMDWSMLRGVETRLRVASGWWPDAQQRRYSHCRNRCNRRGCVIGRRIRTRRKIHRPDQSLHPGSKKMTGGLGGMAHLPPTFPVPASPLHGRHRPRRQFNEIHGDRIGIIVAEMRAHETHYGSDLRRA